MTKLTTPVRESEKEPQKPKTAVRMMEISIDCESDVSHHEKPISEKFEVPVKKKSRTVGKKKNKGNKLNPIGITGKITRNSASRP